MRKKDFRSDKSLALTPAKSMRAFVSDSEFRAVMIASVIFALCYHYMISTELKYGMGGQWCSLGQTALLCLVIGTVVTFFGAKAKMLPALIPIIGLGVTAAALIMFFVVVLQLMGYSYGILSNMQDIMLLAFLALCVLVILMLMLSGVGLKVAPSLGVLPSIVCVCAVILLVVRAMYTFSVLLTALGRDLVLEDGELASEIAWVLRSVQPGAKGVSDMYYARMFGCIGEIALILSCAPLFFGFKGFFEEFDRRIDFYGEIPVVHRVRYEENSGYEEYTVAEPRESQPESTDAEGYYIEKDEDGSSGRLNFNRRVRTEPKEQPQKAPEEPKKAINEVAKPKKIKVVQKPVRTPPPDPRDPSIWNNYLD